MGIILSLSSLLIFLMMKYIQFFTLFFVLNSFAQKEKPNIIFLLVDDLGWADFGCYGASFNETPNIDRLSKESMRFTNAYAACTVCSPSRAAILTGRYPARLHLTDWIEGHKYPYAKLSVPDWKTKIEHKRVLLPEALQQEGYTTQFIGKWHLMPIDKPEFKEHYPTNHGFDTNIGGREWGSPKGRGKYFSPFDMPNLNDGEKGDYLTDKLTDAAIEFLEKQKKENPFFLYFSYYTLHGPVMAPENLVNKYKQKAENFNNYKNEFLNPDRAGMVESLDTSIGRIMDKLNELHLSENTIVILTGDNGGNYDETTGDLKGYKGFSHEGGVREPYIIKWKNQIEANSVCDEVVMGTDFYPTILDLVGAPLQPKEHKDGISLLPLLFGKEKHIQRDAVYWHYPHYHRTKPYGAIRKGDWKLIEFFEDGDLELYNLKTDPFETTNVVSLNKKIASNLLYDLKKWREDVQAQMPTKNINYDPIKAGKKQR